MVSKNKNVYYESSASGHTDGLWAANVNMAAQSLSYREKNGPERFNLNVSAHFPHFYLSFLIIVYTIFLT